MYYNAGGEVTANRTNSKDQSRLEQVLDGWGSGLCEEDANRRDVILAELPKKQFQRALDIGSTTCFVISALPASSVVTINTTALSGWPSPELTRIQHLQLPFYRLKEKFDKTSFDLVTLIDFAYPCNIGNADNLLRLNIDYVLADNGTLLTVHLANEPSCKFAYLREKEVTFDYRGHECLIEVYVR
jgi:hypothetical protein